MTTLLEKLEEAIENKLNAMSNSRYVTQTASADEIYKIACAVKICSKIENNAISRENQAETKKRIEKIINDFDNRKGGLK